MSTRTTTPTTPTTQTTRRVAAGQAARQGDWVIVSSSSPEAGSVPASEWERGDWSAVGHDGAPLDHDARAVHVLRGDAQMRRLSPDLLLLRVGPGGAVLAHDQHTHHTYAPDTCWVAWRQRIADLATLAPRRAED